MRTSVNLLSIALASLSLGTLVYLTRPAGALFLIPNLKESLPPLFGPLSGSLPSFMHALGFTLLSTLALGVSRRTALFSAALWLALETTFEVGQRPIITAQLERLGLGLPYFHYGTFDLFDLTACFAGVALALVILRTAHKESDA